MLHHPDYRARYAENLKRELPRIPIVGTAADFHAFADAGRKLADLHIGYESVKPYKLQRIENPDAPVNWRVEAMKLGKDEHHVVYNDWLTLAGIPPEALKYRLGNRSALAWVIDQYRVERDAEGELVSDPNVPDDEEYIVRLNRSGRRRECQNYGDYRRIACIFASRICSIERPRPLQPPPNFSSSLQVV